MGTGDQESTRLRRVLDSMPGAVFVMDELGTITLVSERASALVGKPAGEIEGSSVLEFVDPDAAWAYATALDIALIDPYLDSFAGPVRISILTADGSVRAPTSRRPIGSTIPTCEVLSAS
jgi:PAS domain S-box-containing protein